jgi:serine/threonine protein kinase
MSISAESKTCPKCGGSIPPEAPEGLCPKCLLLRVSLPTEPAHRSPPKGTPPTIEEVAAAFPQLEILGFIGQGGMGFVFKARQLKLDRLVALKILPESLAADPAFAERFVREGRLLARLNHPHIVGVHDFGQANGFFYLLMEFVDGVNLRQAMKAGRFEPAQALAIVPSICEALQYAHGEGVLHRDIKPENILLDTKGRVKIADFGIAKLLGEPPSEPALTGSGAALGTPLYMAPEQLENPSRVDHRADIYSLGVVFYEMLTGELPIGRFAPPSAKSTVDPRLDEVVLRTLEKERERRTQTASEVKTQVESISRGERILDPNVVWVQPAPAEGHKSRRTKLAVAAGVALGLIFIVGLVVLTQIWRKDRGGRQPAPAAIAPPLTKTVMLTRATNQWVGTGKETSSMGLWTDTTVNPGETLLALVKKPDGSLTDAHSLQFIQWQPDGVKTSTSLSWFFGGNWSAGFGESEAEVALSQLREHWSDKPVTLTADKPLELFAVTNHSGSVLAGYLKYVRSVPNPKGSNGKPQAIVNVRRYAAYSPSIDYSVKLPPGYALYATASMGQVSTHFPQASKPGDYYSAWFRPPTAPSDYRDYPARVQAQREVLEQQFQALLDRGPIPVVLGEPCEVFAVTNKNGEVYRGFFELVGAGAWPGSGSSVQ